MRNKQGAVKKSSRRGAGARKAQREEAREASKEQREGMKE
jgi:hypothetical protein